MQYFLVKSRANRIRALMRYSRHKEAYAFFQWCDRLSLILCNRQLPVDERALEIAKRPDGDRYEIVQFNDSKSNAELTAQLQTAPRKSLEWTFVKV